MIKPVFIKENTYHGFGLWWGEGRICLAIYRWSWTWGVE